MGFWKGAVRYTRQERQVKKNNSVYFQNVVSSCFLSCMMTIYSRPKVLTHKGQLSSLWNPALKLYCSLVLYWFLKLFIQQISIEHLWCAGHRAKHWGYTDAPWKKRQAPAFSEYTVQWVKDEGCWPCERQCDDGVKRGPGRRLPWVRSPRYPFLAVILNFRIP